MTIRVLVVDDSAVVRQLLTEVLAESGLIEVIGTAPDPFVARDKIVRLSPDVVTLDIEMPRMDGVTFLRKLMAYFPLPVVVVSSLTNEGGALALEAMRAGAVDVVCKSDGPYTVRRMGADLVERICAAAQANVDQLKVLADDTGAGAMAPRLSLSRTSTSVLAIGASAGGTRAIEEILVQFPANGPSTVVVQHMPAAFTRSFAARLDSMSDMTVKEARDGDRVVPGTVLVCPGNRHIQLRRSGANYLVVLGDGPRVGRHRPSVDVLFRSVATYAGRNSVGVLLTGMGADGAEGLREMRAAGAATIAQSEESCVVFGMPRAAIELGAVDHIVPLNEIAQRALLLIEHSQSHG